MIRRPPRSTRTDTLFPYTTLFRSGQADYSILDGEQMATHVVMQEDRTIMTMDPAKLAAAGVANSKNTEPMGQGAKKMGEREIRGFDTTGYRFEFMGTIDSGRASGRERVCTYL